MAPSPANRRRNDDEKVGIVIDGKLDREWAAKLMDCRRIYLLNEAKPNDAMPSALRRRILSVYNMSEELEELFGDPAESQPMLCRL